MCRVVLQCALCVAVCVPALVKTNPSVGRYNEVGGVRRLPHNHNGATTIDDIRKFLETVTAVIVMPNDVLRQYHGLQPATYSRSESSDQQEDATASSRRTARNWRKPTNTQPLRTEHSARDTHKRTKHRKNWQEKNNKERSRRFKKILKKLGKYKRDPSHVGEKHYHSTLHGNGTKTEYENKTDKVKRKIVRATTISDKFRIFIDKRDSSSIDKKNYSFGIFRRNKFKDGKLDRPGLREWNKRQHINLDRSSTFKHRKKSKQKKTFNNHRMKIKQHGENVKSVLKHEVKDYGSSRDEGLVREWWSGNNNGRRPKTVEAKTMLNYSKTVEKTMSKFLSNVPHLVRIISHLKALMTKLIKKNRVDISDESLMLYDSGAVDEVCYCSASSLSNVLTASLTVLITIISYMISSAYLIGGFSKLSLASLSLGREMKSNADRFIKPSQINSLEDHLRLTNKKFDIEKNTRTKAKPDDGIEYRQRDLKTKFRKRVRKQRSIIKSNPNTGDVKYVRLKTLQRLGRLASHHSTPVYGPILHDGDVSLQNLTQHLHLRREAVLGPPLVHSIIRQQSPPLLTHHHQQPYEEASDATVETDSPVHDETITIESEHTTSKRFQPRKPLIKTSSCTCPDTHSSLSTAVGYLPLAAAIGFTASVSTQAAIASITSITSSAAATAATTTSAATASVTVTGTGTVTSTEVNTPTMTNSAADTVDVSALSVVSDTTLNTLANDQTSTISNVNTQLGR